MVNKTPYNLKLIEKRFNSLTGKELDDDYVSYRVKESNGSVCLSEFNQANTSDSPADGHVIKKYKFTASLDEYSILDCLNLTKTRKFLSYLN